MDYDKFKRQIVLHESRKVLPYDDQTGIEIPKGGILHGAITIGIGHNLSASGLYPSIIDLLYAEDVASVLSNVLVHFPWWVTLDDVRQRVIMDMAFNIGTAGLLKFHEVLEGARTHDYERAARGMESSLWYKQVGSRSKRLTAMMRTGIDPREIIG